MNDDFIRVRDNIVRTAFMMGARQLVLILGGYLFSRFTLSSDFVEAAATGLVVIGTFGYGQFKGWIEKRKAIALARSAPDGVVVK